MQEENENSIECGIRWNEKKEMCDGDFPMQQPGFMVLQSFHPGEGGGTSLVV